MYALFFLLLFLLLSLFVVVVSFKGNLCLARWSCSSRRRERSIHPTEPYAISLISTDANHCFCRYRGLQSYSSLRSTKSKRACCLNTCFEDSGKSFLLCYTCEWWTHKYKYFYTIRKDSGKSIILISNRQINPNGFNRHTIRTMQP